MLASASARDRVEMPTKGNRGCRERTNKDRKGLCVFNAKYAMTMMRRYDALLSSFIIIFTIVKQKRINTHAWGFGVLGPRAIVCRIIGFAE